MSPKNAPNIKCKVAIDIFDNKMKKRECTGFKRKNTDHAYFRLYINGTNTGIRTKFSFGSREYVHSDVPKQLKITKKYFEGIIDCTNSLTDYIRMLLNNPEMRYKLGLT